jgi:hypothetical protein
VGNTGLFLVCAGLAASTVAIVALAGPGSTQASPIAQ